MSTLEPIAVRANPPAVLDLPPVHLELTWRPLSPYDAAALATLVQSVETVDRSYRRTSSEEVQQLLRGEWKDLAHDSLGGFDDGGALRAFAMVEVRPGDERTLRAFLTGAVHPQWRGRGIGRAVLSWMEGRGRQMLAASGKDLPARLAVYVDEAARDQRRLYAAAGFSPVRWYHDMRRDLRAPVTPPSVPEWLRIVPWCPSLDERVRLAHNETFADHWGSEPQTPETWKAHGGHFAPDWSFVVLDERSGTEEVAAYLLSGRYEQAWAVRGYSYGYTELLGVRAPWRSQGLAIALLATAMLAYQSDGMQYASLSVDTANPSGAHDLYARLGYEATHGDVLYSVEI